MQDKRESRGSPLNRPSSLEAIFRDNFYNARHRIKRSEVRLQPYKGYEGVRCGWYDFGSKVVAWGLTEILPGGSGPMHRQLCESTMFVLEGQGYTLVNGRRFEWEKGDIVFIPLFAWHQHTNTGNVPAIWLKNTSAGLYNQLSMLLRNEKVDFKGDVSLFKDDFKPF